MSSENLKYNLIDAMPQIWHYKVCPRYRRRKLIKQLPKALAIDARRKIVLKALNIFSKTLKNINDKKSVESDIKYFKNLIGRWERCYNRQSMKNTIQHLLAAES